MNVKNKKGVLVLVLMIILFILSLYFDSDIVKGISHIKNAFLDKALMALTFTSTEIIIFFILASIILWSKNRAKWIMPLWFTGVLSFIASFILKISIQRPRPFQLGLIEISSFLIKNSYYLWDFSFPSAQTMFVFCTIPILSKEIPKLKYAWIALACLVGFSRIYFGFHFLSDVIAGAAIGYLFGALIISIEKDNKFWENMYWKIYEMFVR